MDWRVPLADLDLGEEEDRAVLDVLHSRWLTMGSVTQAFESEFSSFVGSKHALAVTNATTALHLACLAVGVRPGDQVIAPSLTFVATTNVALYAGATVRFADICSPMDLTLAPDDVERKITSRTRAIIVMHYGGFPSRMNEIMEIASRHHIAVIEDTAHAPGASLQGKMLGTWGDAGCFSFFSNKNLSTGEGGMLVTNRDDIAERVRLLRSHGMTSLTWDRHQGHAHSYDVVDLGYNYRIDEIRSALGRVQLRKLEKNNARRKAIAELYRKGLAGTGVDLPFSEAVGESSHHLFPILLPPDADRAGFIENMRLKGIQTSIHYPAIHQFSYYRLLYPQVSLPVTESVASREVTLPLFPGMTDGQVGAVLAAVRDSLSVG